MNKKSWSFIQHSTDFLMRPRIGDAKHPTLWPSEATAIIKENGKDKVVGKCRRAVFFRYLEACYSFYSQYDHYGSLVERIKREKLPPDKYMLWVWKAGELYEDYLINIAKESGTYVGGQISVYIPDFNISGKVDILTVNPDTHKYSNVEAKSVYGHGGKEVLGTPAERRKGQTGTPRHSNLMQIALYDWWTASHDDAYEYSRLIYGARDTGLYSEYGVYTKENEETKETEIFYFGIAPNQSKPVKSPITINSILEQYTYIQTCLDSGQIPERDYELLYSQERIQEMYDAGALGKTDTEKQEKYMKYISGESKRKIKPLIKGDWQCDRCNLKNICYQSTDITSPKYGLPKEI